MAQDITGTGVVVSLIASTTFPVGIPLTQFADDADALDMPSIQIADVAMGLNGDLVSWSRANPLPIVIAVVPGSEDDLNLQILADANRVGQGKASAYDDITLTIVYPDGSIVQFTGGKLTDAMFGKSVSNSGRIKTRSYSFKFEQKNG